MEIICNTPYVYHGSNAVEIHEGESMTDKSMDIPLDVIIRRLQSGVPTGLGTGLTYAYDIEDGDESPLDEDRPHITDPLDAKRYMQETLEKRQIIENKKKVLIAEKQRKEYDEFKKYQAEKKNAPPTLPPDK